MANEARSVVLSVKRKTTDTFGNAVTLCKEDTKYYTKVTWYASSTDEELENEPFDVKIWQPGDENPSQPDGYPPAGATNTMIEDWVEPANPDASNFEQEIVIDETLVPAVAFQIGSHQIRAWVHRRETDPPKAWAHSTARTVDIIEISDVEWETYPGNTALDTCPKNGGKRIYPGKQTYNDQDATDRMKVKLKATINPALQYKKVYFKWFDVDDPSTDDSPIDNNGASGGDNKDEENTPGFGETLTKTTWTTTNADGEATVTFTVTMQPGDNFKIAVAACEDHITEVDQTDVDGGTLPGCVVLSPMLTVWRHLWIERDCMNPVATTGDEKNHVAGTADSYTYNAVTNRTEIDLGQNMPDHFDDEDQFEGGVYKAGGNSYTVLSYTDSIGDDEIVVQGDPGGDGVGMSYLLYDDDDQDLLDSVYYCSLGALESAFRDAYIEPEYLSGYSDRVPFNLNLTDTELSIGVDYDNEQDIWSSWNFWACLVVTTYQPTYSQDMDPDGSGPMSPACDPEISGGATPEDDDNAAAIFLEVLTNEPFWSEEKTVAHEIGHTGGPGECTSGDPCIMCQTGWGGPWDASFCEYCLNSFRKYSVWVTTNE